MSFPKSPQKFNQEHLTSRWGYSIYTSFHIKYAAPKSAKLALATGCGMQKRGSNTTWRCDFDNPHKIADSKHAAFFEKNSMIPS